MNLSGKRVLVCGVANQRSLAWAIAQACHEAGAELAFTYLNERMEGSVRKLGERIGVSQYFELDVCNEAHFDALADGIRDVWGGLDHVVHSIAFANKDAFDSRFHETTRQDFIQAVDISAYSLIPLCRALKPLLSPGAGVVAMTYYGAEKVVPMYKVMGVAKATLEATAAYLAEDLGPDDIRVNCLSAGPVRTLAAAGIPGFRDLMRDAEARMPLRRHITTEEVASATLFLLTNTGVTGEVLHVDAGYNILG
ncbi:MAG: enoyl-ACP reductase [Myxococcota bacterium]|nr:enoyl-ACP reductase [Myxococcota bacterium]